MIQPDPATLYVLNGCPIGIVLTGVSIGGNYFPCGDPTCFVAVNTGHTIVSGPPIWGRIDRVDVQYLN